MLENSIKYLEKIIFFIIKGIIFLVPLFFLPWTSEYFEFSKQFLLWLLALAAAWLWFCKIAAEGQVKIKINPLNLPVLIFLLLTAAASAFGLDRFSSFFGHYGRFSDAWFGLLSLMVLYFLIINSQVADSAKKIIGLLKLLLYSALIVACLSFLARLGWLGTVSGGYSSILASGSFSPAGGSLLSLAIFLAIMSIIPASFLFSGGLKKFEQIFFGVCLIMFLVTLALINFPLSWALALLGAGLMIFFRLLAVGFNKILNYYLLIPAALLLTAILLLSLPNLNLAKIVLGRELPKEAFLLYDQSWDITREAFKMDPLLGSGPGTFAQDFSLFRPAELNSSVFWQIRFDKSRSHILEMLATTGLLTCLSYFLIICLVIYLNIILIKKYLVDRQTEAEIKAVDENYNLAVILFSVFILLVCSQFFFLTNTVLNFIFWFILGLIIAFWQRSNQILFREKIINLCQTVWFYRLTILALFILSVGVVMFLIFAVKFFAADIIAARGPRSETGLMAAIKLNPYRYNYRLNLAKLYLNQARTGALKPAERIDNIKIQDSIARAIAEAQAASAIAPNSVLPRETLAMIYRDIKPLTIDSEPWAVRYFSSALELEPTNPVLATELAKIYLDLNDLVNAEKYFRKAMELKADYYEAKFGLAKIYLNGEKDNQALVLLNELASQVQTAEVYYELGRFYYNHGEIDKAVDRFKLVLSISPRQVNSLYSLAVAYEAKGDAKEALKYYQQVFELDKANQEVEKKIKELSK